MGALLCARLRRIGRQTIHFPGTFYPAFNRAAPVGGHMPAQTDLLMPKFPIPLVKVKWKRGPSDG